MFRYSSSGLSLWRGAAWFLLPLGALPVAIYCLATDTTLYIALAVMYALTFVGQILYLKNALAVGKRVRDTQGALCPWCGYALVGLDNPNHCPECGRAIDAKEVVAYWKSTVPNKTWRKWTDEASERHPPQHQAPQPTNEARNPPGPTPPPTAP